MRVFPEQVSGFGAGLASVTAAGDRCGDQFGGHRRRLRVVEARPDLGGPVRLDVAGENHSIAYGRILQSCNDAVAVADVAVPGIGIEAAARPAFEVQLREEHLLAEDVPGAEVLPEPVEQPGLLRRAGDAADGIGSASAQTFQPSPQAWSSRNCRVSSMWNVASAPTAPAGTAGCCCRRRGLGRAQRHVLVVRPVRPQPADPRSPVRLRRCSRRHQCVASSWSSNTTSQGAAACAACRSGSVLYCA